MKDKAALISLIQQSVKTPYQKGLLEAIKPSIRLKTTGAPAPEIGATKLGGAPDLPTGMDWPKSENDGRYLTFLGQVHLAETAAYDEVGDLPTTGSLYFFYDMDSWTEGKVIYDEGSPSARTPIPEALFPKPKSFHQRVFTGKSTTRILQESGVEIYREYHFPSWDSMKMERIQKMTQTDLKPIDAFEEAIFDRKYDEGESETTSNHHLLGNYQGIQNEYHELDFVDETGDIGSLSMATMEQALQWKLLMQFDSDNQLKISWGDWGRIYYFIHEDDLAARRFDRIKVVGDCY